MINSGGLFILDNLAKLANALECTVRESKLHCCQAVVSVSHLKEHVALDRSSWSLKSICDHLL